jgi:dienelactone hydrolase
MFTRKAPRVYFFCFYLTFFLIPALWHTQPSEMTITIQPAEAIYGTPFSITISGLKPGEEATLKARAIDGSGIFWESTATYKADNNGVIDLSSQAPLSGDYDEPDVMGLLWSMKPTNSRNKDIAFRKYSQGLTVEYRLKNEKGETTTTSLKRYYQKPDEGLVQVLMDANGCKGFLYYPETGGPFPGVILLGGSSGGMSTILASALASNGFATLALAYFRYPELPGYLEEIPLEYFKGAIEWMHNQRAVQKTKPGLVGHSKGGECALLLASLYDEFNAVVAYVPSAYVWKCVSPNIKSSWSLAGKGLPFISTVETQEEVQQFYRGELPSIRKWFTDGLAAAEPDLVEKATIPVEKIKAPVFLVSDTGDRTWPSSEFCETIMQRLKAHHFPYEYKHIRSEKAGHQVYYPDFIPGTDLGVDGGEPRAKVKWSLLVWQETLAFLNKHLHKGSIALFSEIKTHNLSQISYK